MNGNIHATWVQVKSQMQSLGIEISFNIFSKERSYNIRFCYLMTTMR